MDEFTYDYSESSTRTTLGADARHNVWFAHSGPESLLVHEPALTRSISSDGTAIVHWEPGELAKHVAVCAEALAQLDFYKTAEEERRYDAYIDSVTDDIPYGMETR